MTQDKRNALFYSWQSDLHRETNKHFIRDVLKGALKDLKREESDLDLRVDSDTLGLTGSPDIASEIFGKIDNCFAFVADIAIINGGTNGQRLAPNPNVLVELGYAAKSIGWNRVITFFNGNYGKIEDLPFDLRGRRHHRFNLSDTASDEDVRKQYDSLLPSVKAQIKAIANSPPQTQLELETVSSAAMKRKRDIENLTLVLSMVSTSAIETHYTLFREKEMIDLDVLSDFYNLEFIESPRFHIYDEDLRKGLLRLLECLGKTVNHGESYTWATGSLYRVFRGNWRMADDVEKIVKVLTQEMVDLETALKSLMKYVHEKYEMIDTIKLNRIAQKKHAEENAAIEKQIFSSRRKKNTKKKK